MFCMILICLIPYVVNTLLPKQDGSEETPLSVCNGNGGRCSI